MCSPWKIWSTPRAPLCFRLIEPVAEMQLSMVWKKVSDPVQGGRGFYLRSGALHPGLSFSPKTKQRAGTHFNGFRPYSVLSQPSSSMLIFTTHFRLVAGASPSISAGRWASQGKKMPKQPAVATSVLSLATDSSRAMSFLRVGLLHRLGAQVGGHPDLLASLGPVHQVNIFLVDLRMGALIAVGGHIHHVGKHPVPLQG